MSYLRDSQPVIIHCDTDYIRAVHGLAEFFNRPAVTLRACYAVPSSSSKTETNGDVPMREETTTPGPEISSRSNWLIGDDLSNAEKEADFKEKYEVHWPFRSNKSNDDCDGRAYVLTHVYTMLGLKISTNSLPLLFIPPPSPTFPLSLQASYTQLAFESLNTPVFSIIPSPLASLYALGSTTGIVIHIGRNESTIFVITDSVVRWECSTTVNVGEADCEDFFRDLLMEDELLEQELKSASEKAELTSEEKKKLVKEVAEFVWKECTGDDIEIPIYKSGNRGMTGGLAGGTGAGAGAGDKEDDSFDVAKKLVGDVAPAQAVQSHKSKKQQAAAAAAAAKSAQAIADAAAVAAQNIDTIVINIPSLPGKEFQLGPVRHRLCEPLLFGKNRTGDTVWEGVGRAIDNASLSIGERLSLWEGVGVVGELARFRSLSPSLVTYLAPYLLSSTDLTSDCQPGKIRLLNIPDYFANFKNSTSELAPFLGGSLVAKVAFSDSQGKHAISKIDYNQKGPAAIYNVSLEGQ
ncbi:uncharacterized protein IL334_003598 [Kwoniella shivajii]|uniref:RNA polymerase II transcription factor n=1 Tax=Kwoniella shivajii TaxID=564305 RepID=A0ABZ1CY14_9TREE|nr:hypothetical protein IL334_003598 [Kwoniella shivajii]